MAMTYYVQITEPGERLDPKGWRPWLSVKPADDVVAMAAFRFAQARGVT